MPHTVLNQTVFFICVSVVKGYFLLGLSFLCFGDIVMYITMCGAGVRGGAMVNQLMHAEWTNDSPIYRQLREQVQGLILNGSLKEGEAVPSVRQVSGELKINHLTVAKAYQELVDMGVLEMRRGMGMFVVQGAQDKMNQYEQERFLSIELPQLLNRLKQLGISKKRLMEQLKQLEDEGDAV
jgi:GntR family transcriptional regulator